MSLTASPELTNLIAAAGLPLLGLALLLSFFRLVHGPAPIDRVVALDLITLQATLAGAVYAIWTGDRAYLDVTLVLAASFFLGTLAFARFLERRRDGGEDG